MSSRSESANDESRDDSRTVPANESINESTELDPAPGSPSTNVGRHSDGAADWSRSPATAQAANGEGSIDGGRIDGDGTDRSAGESGEVSDAEWLAAGRRWVAEQSDWAEVDEALDSVGSTNGNAAGGDVPSAAHRENAASESGERSAEPVLVGAEVSGTDNTTGTTPGNTTGSASATDPTAADTEGSELVAATDVDLISDGLDGSGAEPPSLGTPQPGSLAASLVMARALRSQVADATGIEPHKVEYIETSRTTISGAPPSQPPAMTPPPNDLASPPPPPTADGRARRRKALILFLVALLAGVAGMLIGRRIQSPADRAAERQAPTPSLITVPVEKRELSSELILNGSVTYASPADVSLAGPVAITADETSVVTSAPERESTVKEGDVLLQVTGRPVFVLQGAAPMYRRLTVGMKGADVAELEASLKRLGLLEGEPNDQMDAATMTAVSQLYTNHGFTPEVPSAEQQDRISSAQSAVTQAKQQLVTAQDALDNAGTLTGSAKLELDRALNVAEQAVPNAQAAVTRVTQEQDGLVASAIAARDGAASAAQAAQTLLDSARNGGIDPATGQPYTGEAINQLQIDAGTSAASAAEAQAQLDAAQGARTTAIAEANAALEQARFDLQLERTRYKEQTNPSTAEQKSQVDVAQTAVDDAVKELNRVTASAGTGVPAGEIVFVPTLPAKVVDWQAAVGSPTTGVLGSLATAATSVTASVARSDAALVVKGAKVDVSVPDVGANFTGTVQSVGEAPAKANDGEGSPSSGGGTDGRLVAIVTPDDNTDLSEYAEYPARVSITIDSTDAEQLVVPVSALTVGPDGKDQVEVQRVAATDTEPAVTDNVAVTVGLTADGLAAVVPNDPKALVEGDRVVIGFQWADRGVESDQTVPEGATTDGSTTDGGKDEQTKGTDADSSSDSGDGGDESASPLEALLGFSNDPVAQRKMELEVEEQTAVCMKELGFEYKPVDYSAQFGSDDAAGMSMADYGKKYGYGIVRNYETYQMNPEEDLGSTFVDPNQEYLDSLSPDEQQRYYEALYGKDSMTESTSAMVDSTSDVPTSVAPQDQGCNQKAYAAVNGPNLFDNPEMTQALDDIYKQQTENPEFQKLTAAWKDCVKPAIEASGSPLTEASSPDDMYGVVSAMLAAATGQKFQKVSSEEELNEIMNSSDGATESNFNPDTGTGYAITGEPTPPSAAELEKLQAAELTLYQADQSCQESTGFTEYRKNAEQQMADQLTEQFPDLAKKP